ncbi:scaffold/adaptor protein [Lithospermum erythrorhizon]|uniref:Scaffold/adaptor protein n=1 Tax=Lithospermum erythrorhizon TaxID=34254 RepID=A0AAV3QZX9_LITER
MWVGKHHTLIGLFRPGCLIPCTLGNEKQSFKGKLFQTFIILVPYLQHIYHQKMIHIKVIKILEAISGQALTRKNPDIGACISTFGPLVFKAAELGIVEFLVVLIHSYPDFFWKVNEDGHTIFHVAVIHRQEKVFSLINEIGALKDHITLLKDKGRNNMLHLAAKLPSPNRLETDSGAALQLRKELLWFKEVEKIMQPSYKDMENDERKTPQSLFTEEHKVLVKEGEKWMEKTSASCMLVSTLIATVTFAALFTVPGGNNGETGVPIFQGGKAFTLFAISNSLSLICSATSILTFLSILTSRSAEQDFLQSLPRSLLIGLLTLFISIATMMVAFGATLFIVLGHGIRWFSITIGVASGINVIWFAWLHLPLFVDIVSHTYNSKNLFQKPMHLFEINPM